MILNHTFPIFYHEIEKRKTKGRYIHGPIIPYNLRNYNSPRNPIAAAEIIPSRLNSGHLANRDIVK